MGVGRNGKMMGESMQMMFNSIVKKTKLQHTGSGIGSINSNSNKCRAMVINRCISINANHLNVSDKGVERLTKYIPAMGDVVSYMRTDILIKWYLQSCMAFGT